VLPPEAAYEYLLGFWPQSYAHISEAVQLARESDQTPDRILSLHGLAEIEAARGREQQCLDAVHEGRQLAHGIEAMEEWPEFALGLLELGKGRAVEAIRALAPVVRLTSGQGQHRALMAVFDLVEAYVLAGDWERAGAARGRGMLATGDAYDDAFAASADLFAALGMRFEAARTDLCWGERLRRDGRRTACRTRLRAALVTFEELGAQPWAERARNELRASGATIRRAVEDRDELTARELQVALQAAEGKTNREVGAALFLSPKTVDIHLSRAYRKLGIHSRHELASAIGRSAQSSGADR
jgi:DNA-binding CsgD family transcriptional regulator